MIIKLGQYARNGPRFPIKTIENVQDLSSYIRDQDHPNHATTKIGELSGWGCTTEGFTTEITARLGAFKARKKTRGKPWGGQIGEHIIVSPPEGISLTDLERAQMGLDVVSRICPNSPALYNWHIGDDGRDHLHVIACNFTPAPDPRLRITELREEHSSTGYLAILAHVGREVVTAINQARQRANRTLIPTLSEIRAEKRKDAGHDSLPDLLFKRLGPGDCLDRKSIQMLLEEMQWRTRVTKKNLSVTPPKKKKAYRWNWEVLLLQLAQRRDAWLRKALCKDKDEGLDEPKMGID